MTTVLVTGATGFIARHAVTQLLDAGYDVRGSARRASSLDGLRADLTPFLADPATIEKLSIVEADLTGDDGWDAAVEGCPFVLHIASPLPSAPPKDPNELIAPARDGALRVLRAAKRGGVQRVVMTSSVAAVLYGVDRGSRIFTEADWSNPDDHRIGAYEQSKTIAERAAWDFVGSDAGSGLELATVNPGLVLGPMYGNAMSTSIEAVKKILDRAFPAIPDLRYSYVDARDVAAAHLAAMQTPEAAGQRYICGLESQSLLDVARILATAYEPKGYKVPTGRLPDTLVKLVAKFDKTVALTLNDLGNPQRISNAKVVGLLGRPLLDLETMVLATAASLEHYGLVSPKRRRSAG